MLQSLLTLTTPQYKKKFVTFLCLMVFKNTYKVCILHICYMIFCLEKYEWFSWYVTIRFSPYGNIFNTLNIFKKFYPQIFSLRYYIVNLVINILR